MSVSKREGEFWECAECRKRPGSPTLCEACLHNRGVISQLQAKISLLLEGAEKLEGGDFLVAYHEMGLRLERLEAELRGIRDDPRQLRTSVNTPPARTLETRLDQVCQEHFDAGVSKGHRQAAERAKAALEERS